MTHHRRAPRQIGSALQGAQRRWEPTSALGRAQSVWAQVSRAWAVALGAQGAYVLERATPVSLRAGVLTVRCTEAVVADELTLEAGPLIERLNAGLSDSVITELRCVTAA
ncbi:MAG: DciA family protein [Solirubrobacteraceae bacterium]